MNRVGTKIFFRIYFNKLINFYYFTLIILKINQRLYTMIKKEKRRQGRIFKKGNFISVRQELPVVKISSVHYTCEKNY